MRVNDGFECICECGLGFVEGGSCEVEESVRGVLGFMCWFREVMLR